MLRWDTSSVATLATVSWRGYRCGSGNWLQVILFESLIGRGCIPLGSLLSGQKSEAILPYKVAKAGEKVQDGQVNAEKKKLGKGRRKRASRQPEGFTGVKRPRHGDERFTFSCIISFFPLVLSSFRFFSVVLIAFQNSGKKKEASSQLLHTDCHVSQISLIVCSQPGPAAEATTWLQYRQSYTRDRYHTSCHGLRV